MTPRTFLALVQTLGQGFGLMDLAALFQGGRPAEIADDYLTRLQEGRFH